MYMYRSVMCCLFLAIIHFSRFISCAFSTLNLFAVKNIHCPAFGNVIAVIQTRELTGSLAIYAVHVELQKHWRRL